MTYPPSNFPPREDSSVAIQMYRPGNARPARSVRVPDEVWDGANRRASHDGVTRSTAINLLLECYSRGLIDVPTLQMSLDESRAD